jgi:hypothetical protein
MVVYGTPGFGGLESNEGLFGASYRLTRATNGAGWTTMPLALPSSHFADYFESNTQLARVSESRELASSLWIARSSSESADSIGFFLERADGSIVSVGPALPSNIPLSISGLSPTEEGNLAGLGFSGFAEDQTGVPYVVFREKLPWEKAGGGLYEYVGTGNKEPLAVGVDENGLISECGSTLGGGGGFGLNRISQSHNAISSDGRSIFYTAEPTGPTCSGSGPPVAELFVRMDNGTPEARTVAISEPSTTDCASCDSEDKVLAGAHFEGASEDGTRAFFSTSQPLLGGDASRNLYMYDSRASEGQRITRVSAPDSSVKVPKPAELVGSAIQVSEDGSHVYFVANGVLTNHANSQAQRARQGADNLYVFEPDPEHGGGYRPSFIADLCSGPSLSGGVADGRCPATLSEKAFAPTTNDVELWAGFNQGGADVTPDGRFLVFESYGDLTPDDTSGGRQVFEYDSDTGQLVRVSIGQDGFNDNGNTAVGSAEIVSPIYASNAGRGPVRSDPTDYWSAMTVSRDGAYVFFQTPDGLTKSAVNDHLLGEINAGNGATEQIYAQNIYEYHSVNGNIKEGDVSLISDGQDLHSVAAGSPVTLIGADGSERSGQDVFFATVDQLVGQDTNEGVDIYDARVEGGFLAPTPMMRCSENCQGPLSAPPTLLAPGSEFQLGGNPPLSEPTSKPSKKTKVKKAKSKKRKQVGKKAVRARGGRRPGRKRSVR